MSATLRALVVIIALLAAGSPLAVARQAPPAPDRAKVLSAARDVMKQARYATLVTIAEDGQPQARVVDPADPGADLTVWIATNPASRKVSQLRNNSRSTLLYFDRATESYVSLLGAASVVTDSTEKERHWQLRWAPHYPDGPRSTSHMLIRFTPRTLEIVSGPHELHGDPRTWRPVVLELSGQAPAFEPIAGTFSDRLISDNHNGRIELAPSASRDLPGVVPADRVFRGQIPHIRPAGAASGLSIAFVETKDGGVLFVDANVDGRLTEAERMPYTPATDRSSAREVSIDLEARSSGAPLIPFRCGVVTEQRDGARRFYLTFSGIFRAEGHAIIGGNKTLVSLPYSVNRNAVDIRRGMIGIGSKTTFVDDERLIFRTGDRYVSLESADFAARSFVLREHPPEEYRIIEIRRGEPLPDFTFTDLAGRTGKLSDFNGKYLLLDFWGTWCSPCVADLPVLKKLRERFRDRGFEILGMDFEYSATADRVRVFLADRNIPWPNTAPDSVKDLIRNRYRILGFPTLVLLDPDGVVVEIRGHANDMVATLERLFERRLP